MRGRNADVVDLRVADDAKAVAAAKRYLSFFARAAPPAGPAKDQRGLRELIPTNRKRISLESIEEPAEREQAFEAAVAAAYECGKGISTASYLEIDDVIDPPRTRRCMATVFDDREPGWWARPGKSQPNIDTW